MLPVLGQVPAYTPFLVQAGQSSGKEQAVSAFQPVQESLAAGMESPLPLVVVLQQLPDMVPLGGPGALLMPEGGPVLREERGAVVRVAGLQPAGVTGEWLGLHLELQMRSDSQGTGHKLQLHRFFRLRHR